MIQQNLLRFGLLCAVSLTMCAGSEIFAQTVEFRHLETVYDACSQERKIERVELTDESTTVLFRQNKGNSFSLTPSCCLMDAAGRRYALRQVDGQKVEADDTTRVLTQSRFLLTFEPLPVTTRVFDLYAGSTCMDEKIYGIHNRGDALELQTADEEQGTEPLRAELSQKGMAVLRGRVENAKDREKAVWFMTAPDVVNSFWKNYQMPVLIREDGTFEASLPLNHPCLAVLYPGWGSTLSPVQVYLQPNDTVEMHIKNLNGALPLVDYSPNMRFQNLVRHLPATLLPGFCYGSVKEAEGLKAKMKTIGEEEMRMMRLADYLTNQYGLSASEAHLLKNEVRLKHLDMRLDFINSEKDLRDTQKLREAWATYGIPQRLEEIDESYVLNGMSRQVLDRLERPFFRSATWYGERNAEAAAQEWNELDTLARSLDLENGQRSRLVENVLFLRLMSSLVCPGGPSVTAEALHAILSPSLHSDFLLSRLPEALEALSHALDAVSDRSGTYEYAVIDSIAGAHRGKYVEIAAVTEHTRFYELENLVADFADSKDVALVFVCNEDSMTRESFNRLTNFHLAPVRANCHYLTRQDFAKLSVLANHITGDFSYLTLDREGRVFNSYMPLVPESQFRRTIRLLMRDEQQKPADGHGI